MNSAVLLINALLLFSTTTTTLVGGDFLYAQCDVGRNNVDMATVVDMKTILIGDLAKVVPTRDQLHYCNTYGSEGITMFGYAECTHHNSDDLGYCTNCLGYVGDFLAANCNDTGVGHAWDVDSSCYYKIGFTKKICPIV